MKNLLKDRLALAVTGTVFILSFIIGQNYEHHKVFSDYEVYYIDEMTTQYIVNESFDGDCITIYDTKTNKTNDLCDSDL